MDALRCLGMPDHQMSRVGRFIKLPHGGMWAEMVLGPADKNSVNLDDLQDYCYLLRWPKALKTSSALGPALRREEMDALGWPFCSAEDALWPVLTDDPWLGTVGAPAHPSGTRLLER